MLVFLLVLCLRKPSSRLIPHSMSIDVLKALHVILSIPMFPPFLMVLLQLLYLSVSLLKSPMSMVLNVTVSSLIHWKIISFSEELQINSSVTVPKSLLVIKLKIFFALYALTTGKVSRTNSIKIQLNAVTRLLRIAPIAFLTALVPLPLFGYCVFNTYVSCSIMPIICLLKAFH